VGQGGKQDDLKRGGRVGKKTKVKNGGGAGKNVFIARYLSVILGKAAGKASAGGSR